MKVLWIGIDDTEGCTRNWHDLRVELREAHGVEVVGPGYDWPVGTPSLSTLYKRYRPDWIVMDDCNANGVVPVVLDGRPPCKLAWREHDWWNRHRKEAMDKFSPDLILSCYDRDPECFRGAEVRKRPEWRHLPHAINMERFHPGGEQSFAVGFYGKTGKMYPNRVAGRNAVVDRGVSRGDAWVGIHGGYWHDGTAHDDGIKTFYNENLAAALRKCKCLWVDSPDTFGATVLKFFEGAASGCLLIGTPPHASKWEFPHRYMVSCEPAELDEVVDYFVEHEDERQRIVGSQLADLRMNHSIQARARQIMALLEEEL